MNCPSCSEKVTPGSVFCANCGTRLPAPPPPTPPAPQSAPSAASADDTLVGVRPHSLLALVGPEKGQTFPLIKDTTRLGRDLDNEVVLTDPRISRRHAEIELKGQDYLIFDMGSPNGLFVNAIRVTGPQVLRDGDNIRLGDTVLVFSHQPLPSSERKIENITWEPDVTPINKPGPLSSRPTESVTPPPIAKPITPPPPPPPIAKPVTPPPPPPPIAKPVAPPPPPPPPAVVAPERSLDTIVEKKKASDTRWFFMTCLLIVVLLILFAVLVWLAIPRISFSFPSAVLPGS